MKPIIDISQVAAVIKDRLTMQDIVGYYFPDPPPRFKRIPCPLHGGANFNFSFSDKFFKCFVCGASGDIISLVMQFFHLDFVKAVEKIDRDFHLGLTDTAADAAAIDRAAERAKALREERERRRTEAEERYAAALDRWVALDRAMRDHEPGSPSYDTAERQKAIAEYFLDEEEMRLARTRGAYNS